MFRDTLAESLYFARISLEVCEGKLLGLVLKLKLYIGTGYRKAKKWRNGVRKVGNPFVGQIVPWLVASGEEPDFFPVWGNIDVLQRQRTDKIAKLSDRVGH